MFVSQNSARVELLVRQPGGLDPYQADGLEAKITSPTR